MLALESRLAKEIVERTMKIIPFNVNVMDAGGVIIGSGEASRIGEVHAGAQLVLVRQSAVEINRETSSALGEAKPGVNLPLTVRGKICGVVGLTGDPSAVRQFGELVRVNAEMILEQAQLTAELQRERRYQEEFVLQLIKDDGILKTDLEAWAVRLGVNFQRPRAVIVLDLVDPSLRPDMALIEMQRCQAQLAMHRPDLLTAAISHRELVMLEIFDDSAGGTARATPSHQRLHALDALLRETLGTPSALSMGVALTGIDGVAQSYQSARRTFRVGRKRSPHENLFSFYDLNLPVLLSGLESGWQAEQLRRPLERLNAFDKRDGTLRHTLIVWFAQNGQPVATAKALHIHRNTLDYRLRKIGELTGLDLANIEDQLLLYVALQLE